MYYDDDLLERYFEEYLEHYDIDDIKSLLFVLDLEKSIGNDALIIHDKKRSKDYYNKSLDAIESDLLRTVNGIQKDSNIIDAIETLRDFIDMRLSTKRDLKLEIESDFKEDMKNPIFKKLLKDARNFINQ